MNNRKNAEPMDGNAIVYCEGGFNTTNGKTAHGLVRFTRRYRVLSVVDSRHAGKDAGQVLDGRANGIPIFADIETAAAASHQIGAPATHLVVGLAPDGGSLSPAARTDIMHGIASGLNVDCGLHTFLSEDAELTALARDRAVRIRDIRKPPPRDRLHFFSGKIESVDSLKIAVLGTDSAVGKRTTAWLVVQGFEHAGIGVQMIGTGQTAWLQGTRFSLLLDSLVNDFVSGEIEHAVWSAWAETQPQVIVIEGQGSLMNPAYPGGFEILAAGRPDIVVLQHAPARSDYDGFPGYPIQPLRQQIQVIEDISAKPVVAVTLNHENIPSERIPRVCEKLRRETGLPVFDVLAGGTDGLVDVLRQYIKD